MRATGKFDTESGFFRAFRRALSVACALLAGAAWAAPAAVWEPSADGATVVDPVRKLVWDRCAHGQRWNGKTCDAPPVLLTHGEATAMAAERNRNGGKACRVPSVPELQALATSMAATRDKKPALFPAEGASWRWSGTRIVNTASVNQYNYGNVMQGRGNDSGGRVDVLHGWAVDLATGEARRDFPKRTRVPVQLVCALP